MNINQRRTKIQKSRIRIKNTQQNFERIKEERHKLEIEFKEVEEQILKDHYSIKKEKTNI